MYVVSIFYYIYIFFFFPVYCIVIDYDVAFIRASGLQSHLGRGLRNERLEESGKHRKKYEE